MDEIWKNLTLSSLFHPCATAAATQPSLNQRVLLCLSKNDVSQSTGTDRELRITNSGVFSSDSATGKKRSFAIDENIIEKRKKRLMKNREAAVRSRARKQAYTYELEYEVAYLEDENAKLKKQVEELQPRDEVFDYGEHPKKKTLHRTLSSPF